MDLATGAALAAASAAADAQYASLRAEAARQATAVRTFDIGTRTQSSPLPLPTVACRCLPLRCMAPACFAGGGRH